MGHGTVSLAHLEIQIKFAGDLGSLRAVNGYGVDWEFVPFEGPLFGSPGHDHDGKMEVPRKLNGHSRIVMTASTRRQSSHGRPTLGVLRWLQSQTAEILGKTRLESNLEFSGQANENLQWDDGS